MKNNITRLAAAVFVITAVVGAAQLDSARAAFARTTRVVSTGLAGLKEFIWDMSRREPQPPSAVMPAQPSEQQAAVQGNRIFASVQVFSVQPGQQDLQAFFEREDIELTPAGNSPDTTYAKLGPEKTTRFVEWMGRAEGVERLSSPSLMILEGQEGVMGIAGAGEPDAVALALVATVPDDGDSIDLSFSFLHGQSGFEIPSLRIHTDDAVLFRLATAGPTQDKQNDPDASARRECILVLVKTKVFPPS